MAMGVNGEGRRCVLGVEPADRGSHSSWKELLESLRQRGLHGVVCGVRDEHAGLRRAVQELLPEAVWQRCYVHFLGDAPDYLPRKADDDWLMELRRIYDRRNLEEAGRTWGPGRPSRRSAIPSCVTGWKRTSRSPSAFTACRGSTTRT